jgi:hypothetical protein
MCTTLLEWSCLRCKHAYKTQKIDDNSHYDDGTLVAQTPFGHMPDNLQSCRSGPSQVGLRMWANITSSTGDNLFAFFVLACIFCIFLVIKWCGWRVESPDSRQDSASILGS